MPKSANTHAVLRKSRCVLDCAGKLTALESDVEEDCIYGLLWRVGEADVMALNQYERVSQYQHRIEYVDVESYWGNVNAFTYRSMLDTKTSRFDYEYMSRIVQASRGLCFPQNYIIGLRTLR